MLRTTQWVSAIRVQCLRVCVCVCVCVCVVHFAVFEYFLKKLTCTDGDDQPAGNCIGWEFSRGISGQGQCVVVAFCEDCFLVPSTLPSLFLFRPWITLLLASMR